MNARKERNRQAQPLSFSQVPAVGWHSILLKNREIFFQIPIAGDQPLAMCRIWMVIKSTGRSRPEPNSARATADAIRSLTAPESNIHAGFRVHHNAPQLVCRAPIIPRLRLLHTTLTAEMGVEPRVATSLPLLTALVMQLAYFQHDMGALRILFNLARTGKAGATVLVVF